MVKQWECGMWEEPLIVCANVPRFVFWGFFVFSSYVGGEGIGRSRDIRVDWRGRVINMMESLRQSVRVK